MPQISVIIATYNRCESLKETLTTLLNQKCSPELSYEVIVSDNNSKDRTKEVVESYRALFEQSGPKTVRYVFEPKQGKSFALNRAIKEARGDIVAFTDDDVLVDQSWLASIQECFTVYSCDAVGGRVLPLYPKRTPRWIKDNSRILAGPIVMYDYGEGTIAYRKPVFEFIGANFAFKKELFSECGVFRTDIGPGRDTMGDDCEYISRLYKKHKVLYYCGQALIWHPVDLKRTTLPYIAQWYMRLGRYRLLVDEKGKLDGATVYVGQVPRYLIGEIMFGAAALIPKVIRPAEFLKEWIKLATNLGRAMEARQLYQEMKAKEN
jgi:glucosyl-dolichyl phosphate glucuronosyltransferase